MTYQDFLQHCGHKHQPRLEDAYPLWIRDGPESYQHALLLYEAACVQTSLRQRCHYMWRAKKAWRMYLDSQTFPLPLAEVHS